MSESRRRNLARATRCFACGAPGATKHEVGEDSVSSFRLCPACVERTGARPPGTASAQRDKVRADEGTPWEPSGAPCRLSSLPAHSARERERKEDRA